jgi:pyruvate-formate lyase-activating enzyme
MINSFYRLQQAATPLSFRANNTAQSPGRHFNSSSIISTVVQGLLLGCEYCHDYPDTPGEIIPTFHE